MESALERISAYLFVYLVLTLRIALFGCCIGSSVACGCHFRSGLVAMTADRLISGARSSASLKPEIETPGMVLATGLILLHEALGSL